MDDGTSGSLPLFVQYNLDFTFPPDTNDLVVCAQVDAHAWFVCFFFHTDL